MNDLGDSEIDSFRTDGFLVCDRLIDDADVAAARVRFDHLFRGEFETGVMPDEVNWQEGDGDPELTRQICNGWKADRTVARIVLDAGIGRAVARLAGWPGARIMQDNVIWKPQGARPLGYHQDNAYIGWLAPREMLSCWIALDDTTAAGGTMELVRGSHRWPVDPPDGAFHGPDDYRAAMREAAERHGREAEIVPIEVPAGGGVFHHGGIWHGSGYNRSAAPRRSLVLHAVSSEASFVRTRIGEGNGPIYGRYMRLGDSALDENHFPVLWAEDGGRTQGLDDFLSGGGQGL